MSLSKGYLTSDSHYYRVDGQRIRYKLVSVYQNMVNRAKARENCSVFWDNYSQFRVWALANGYQEGLELCRTGDVGNYEPGNVRFDTAASNLEECRQQRHLH